MAILPIYTYGAKVLRKRAKPVRQVDAEILALSMNMFETMRHANGIGLAATQVGELHRVIVVDISDTDDHKDFKPLTIINPVIIHSEGMCTIEEGCLSIPDVRDSVERSEHVEITYKDSNFKDVRLEADGILARVLLHEIDHLNGVLFLDHLTKEQLAAHAEELKKIEAGEITVDYPVISGEHVAT